MGVEEDPSPFCPFSGLSSDSIATFVFGARFLGVVDLAEVAEEGSAWLSISGLISNSSALGLDFRVFLVALGSAGIVGDVLGTSRGIPAFTGGGERLLRGLGAGERLDEGERSRLAEAEPLDRRIGMRIAVV